MTTRAAKKGSVGFWALGIVVAVGFMVALILPVIQRGVRASRRGWCNNHLKGIVLALNGYQARCRCYPPAFVVDRAGKPLYSWRVLILPQMGEEDLYSLLHLDEPWDSPHNRQFAERMPECYRCPADAGARKGETSYLAVVGPHAAWSGSKPVAQGDITDGTSCTLLVAEVAGSGVNWMEPRDLTFDEAAAGVMPDWRGATPGGKLGIRSRHRAVVNCVFCDCSTHVLLKDIGPNQLKAFLTRDGGDNNEFGDYFQREMELLPGLVD